MKLLKKIKYGFTLLEIIIALGIFTIVMTVVFPFFLSNCKTINKTNVKSELQWEAENIIKYMSKSFMEGSSIEKIGYDSNNNVNYIKINLDNNEYYLFKLEKNKLIYESSEKEIKNVIGENISKLRVKPFKNEKDDFSYIRGVDIEIVLEKKKEKYEIKDHIFLRNSN